MTGEPPQARLRIRNHSDRLLELRLEHYGEDYWLKPNEEAVFITIGFEGPSPWSVMTGPGEPFDVDYYPAMVVVNFNGAQAWATDPAGNILCCGHQRPEPPPAQLSHQRTGGELAAADEPACTPDSVAGD